MPAPSLSESRAKVDAVLTNLALGYKPQSSGYIGLQIAPPVPVNEYGGRILEFDDSCFEEVDDRRADGGEYREISRYYEGKPFSIEEHGLKYRLPEKALHQASKRGVNWSRLAVEDLTERSALMVERDIARMVLNPNNYPDDNKIIVGPGSYWGGADAANIDPYETILETKRFLVSKVAADPNTLVLGREVYDKMITNSKITEHYQYTSADAVTHKILAQRFGVSQILVGSAISKPTATSPKGFLWGNFAVLCYVNRNAISGSMGLGAEAGVARQEPSAFYTYTFDGHPRVSEQWYENRTGSYFRKIDYDRTPVTAMPQGAFLFINPVL